MRKILSVIIMFTLISSLMSADSFEPLSVEFTVDGTVNAGFTENKVVSTIKPGDKEEVSEKKFTYNSTNNSFVLSNLYYYVQTFTAKNIMVTLKGDPLKQEGGSESISWLSSSDDTSGLSSGAAAKTVVDETSETNHMYPRVYSGEIYIEIPIENVKNTESSYTATLTLEVTSK